MIGDVTDDSNQPAGSLLRPSRGVNEKALKMTPRHGPPHYGPEHPTIQA